MLLSKKKKNVLPESVQKEGPFTARSFVKRNSWTPTPFKDGANRSAFSRRRNSGDATNAILPSVIPRSSTNTKEPQSRMANPKLSQSDHKPRDLNELELTNSSLLKLRSQDSGSDLKASPSPRSTKTRGSLSLGASLNIPESIPEVTLPRRALVSFQPGNFPAKFDEEAGEESEESEEYVYYRSPVRASDLVVPCSGTFEEVLRYIELEQCRQDKMRFGPSKN
ncbi:hypothetical protein T265_04540 [Opisthorchis viverrini]|uniref:Uncharacterized protein n=1 Tax=Opisthorchis viverrini TaxID=6198 RepID=A0A074ZS88_OPIVI|nr:hypothetical protein T265_04540 [Opisthorchis viverrini]KER28667.1 hypothetical protein T265_04540 [Opisthorchis viverrini]